ncbi:hypothetical protein ITX31_02580 [Arthrobacter gandavensis]|uniref:hypothetical protein n=1 Tax=Arthrobacter gandavensis TaxID=169960 RepID=UPI00188E8B7F|nr:hypothetical protein [Arthrobacter gandavensis]MBF4992997.1 hypothetical protein [Arthrobacter gandavensis]
MIPSRRTSAPRGARAGLALLGAGVYAAMSLAAAPAAHADAESLQVSFDGSSFTGSASRPVFPEGLRLVPGSSQSGALWVRNNSAEPAYLSLAVAGRGIGPELAGYLEVRSRSGAGAESAALPGSVACSDLGTPVLLEAGAARRVDLSAGLVLEAPNSTMNQRGSFDILLLLDAAGGRSACQPANAPDNQVPAPGGQDGGSSTGRSGNAVQTAPGAAAVVTIPGTGEAAAPLNAVPVFGEAIAAPAGLPKASGPPGLPPRITPASFLESTVEPIIRTWQGTLMVLLAAAFFAAAAARIRITRRTP